MRDDYKVNGPTLKLNIEFETDVAEKLKQMCKFRGLNESDIVNTAMKRFISTHKDFLPPKEATGDKK